MDLFCLKVPQKPLWIFRLLYTYLYAETFAHIKNQIYQWTQSIHTKHNLCFASNQAVTSIRSTLLWTSCRISVGMLTATDWSVLNWAARATAGGAVVCMFSISLYGYKSSRTTFLPARLINVRLILLPEKRSFLMPDSMALATSSLASPSLRTVRAGYILFFRRIQFLMFMKKPIYEMKQYEVNSTK